MAEAFRARGLEMPKVRLFSFSAHLVNHFVANGPFLTANPRSVARFCSLKALPIKLPTRPWLVMIVTLKARKPVAQIDLCRMNVRWRRWHKDTAAVLRQ